MEKFIEHLQKTKKIINNADHLIYVTFPIVQDKKIILKIVKETKIAIANCINLILQYEALYKRIRLFRDPQLNFKTFIEKCAPRYNISQQEIHLIKELFRIVELHKQSSMEFTRREKIVILSENYAPKILSLEDTKKFISLAKNILNKTTTKILKK